MTDDGNDPSGSSDVFAVGRWACIGGGIRRRVVELVNRAESERRLVIGLGVLLGFAVAWNLIGNLALPGAWYVPANIAAAAIAVVVAVGAGLTVDDLGLGVRNARRGVMVGLVAVAVIAAGLAVVLLVPAGESAFEDDAVAADSTGTRWFMTLVRIPLGTAVLEELLFRGALFGLVLRLSDRRMAIATTSSLFGLWHIVPAWEMADGSAAAVAGTVVATVLFTGAGGVVFALLRVWSRSVIAPMLAHWATNSLSYAAAIVALDILD